LERFKIAIAILFANIYPNAVPEGTKKQPIGYVARF